MIAPVALHKCTTYDESAVEETVRHSLELLGGMGRYVSPGQRVLLKVNLLRATAPEETVCTHPAVVKAVVHLVQEAGGHPIIGDSPGGPFSGAWVRPIYYLSGMSRLAEETGAELNADWGQTHLSHPDGHAIKALDVGTYARNADVVLSLPKLKTHSFMQFTGGTKNLFGVVPGMTKLAYHAKFPDPDRFGDMLIDIVTLIRPALTLMDAVVGMEGNGPSAGEPFQVGAILASEDAVALDVVAASLVGIDVDRIYPLRAAMARGLTSGHVEDVPILGDSLGELRVQGFRAPETHDSSHPLLTFLHRFTKNSLVAAPQPNGSCIGCGICVRNCPVRAIQLVEVGAPTRRAQIDLATCIRCYCCHETCPERAIDLRKPWLGRLLA